MQLLRALSNYRLTLTLLAVILIFLAFSLVPQSAMPELLHYGFFQMGFLELWQSKGFIAVLIALLLNLFLQFIWDPASRSGWTQKVNRLPLEQLQWMTNNSENPADDKDTYWISRIRCAMAEEDFEEIVRKIAPGRIQRLTARAEPSQFFARNRPGLLWSARLALVAIFILAIGFYQSARHSFLGSFSLEPQETLTHIELLKGHPAHWQPYNLGPQPTVAASDASSYVIPPFELKLERLWADFYQGGQNLRSLQSWVSIYSDQNFLRTDRVAIGEPLELWGKYQLIQKSYSSTGKRSMDLYVLQADRESYQVYRNLQVGQTLQVDLVKPEGIESGELSIVKMDSALERVGDALQVQWQSKGKALENFWVFENYPEVRPQLKISPFHEVYRAEFLLTYDPGLIWLQWGMGILILAFLIGAFSSSGSYWFVWQSDSIWMLAPVKSAALISYDFERRAGQFHKELVKMDRRARQIKNEVQRGFF